MINSNPNEHLNGQLTIDYLKTRLFNGYSYSHNDGYDTYTFKKQGRLGDKFAFLSKRDLLEQPDKLLTAIYRS